MSNDLQLTMDWEQLEAVPAEERACFGRLQIRLGSIMLSEGQDGFVGCARTGPLVSAYPLAEWFAWNWWRLTVEPRPNAPTYEWQSAHCLSTVGAGYLWPNITIHSDGETTVLAARPTHPTGLSPFRFTADQTAIVPTRQFVAALDEFLSQIQGRLRAEGIEATDFDTTWSDVLQERATPEDAAQRQLEALLGFDPDEGDQAAIRRIIQDARTLGQHAVMELAAGHTPGRMPPSADQIEDWARRYGHDTQPSARVDLTGLDSTKPRPRRAWQRGYSAARAVRAHSRLGNGPVSDQRLADLCAVSASILGHAEHPPLAFGLEDEAHTSGRIVLRSSYRTGRRFELARLLGDRLASGCTEALAPVSSSYTYRQKLQRAFAAELLCPFESLDAFLDGDYSESAQDDAAQHFAVSERVVEKQLENHCRLDTDALDSAERIAPA